MARFILWMIIVFIGAKIVGLLVRSLRGLMTPNKNVFTRNSRSRFGHSKHVEDVPYEEIKEK